MRFSLGTLVLVVLWLGSVAIVWKQRDPWVRFTPKTFCLIGSDISPDKTRRGAIRHVDEFPDCVVIEQFAGNDPGHELWQKEGNFLNVFFVDDDTLCLVAYDEPTDQPQTYHRRFPEWGWGKFLRPELWCAIVTSIALIGRLLTRLNSKRQKEDGFSIQHSHALNL